MTKYNLITDASELAKTGKELANDIRNTDERIQLYLLSEVVHIEQHRNPTRLNLFFSMVKGSGARINAMHNFVQVFGNVSFNREANSAIKSNGTLNDNNKFGRKAEDGTIYAWYYSINKARKTVKIKEKIDGKEVNKTISVEENFGRAQNAPWHTFQPERAPAEFNADNKFLGLVKSFWKTTLEGDAIISKELLSDLTDLVFKHGLADKEGKKITPEVLIPSSIKVTEVPKEYRAALHLVVDNTKDETKAETSATPKAEKPTDKPKAAAKSA